jgi:hypothetical protein
VSRAARAGVHLALPGLAGTWCEQVRKKKTRKNNLYFCTAFFFLSFCFF